MTRPEPQLDLSKIAFPSDQLTIKRLRELFPDSFDGEDGVRYFNNDELAVMMSGERRLAQFAFDTALGKKSTTHRDTEVGYLTECYELHKMVTGRHQAEQLIRPFEQAAAAQARGPGHPQPSR